MVDISYVSKVDDDSEVNLLFRNAPNQNASSETISVKGQGTSRTTSSKNPIGSTTLLSKARSQEPVRVDPPLSNSQNIKFSEETSPVTGTLIDLTKVDPKLVASFLEQLSISKILPKSSMAESTLRNKSIWILQN